MRPLNSTTLDPPAQLRLLIVPTVPGAEILAATLEKLKFGWLKASSAAAVNVNFRPLGHRKSLGEFEILFSALPGRFRMFAPEFAEPPLRGSGENKKH